MPQLDVNDAFDPIMMDTFVVIRQTESMTNTGRTVLSSQAISAEGVITAASPNDLQYIAETEFMHKAISIYTPFRVQGAAPGMHSDVILWHGSEFLVNMVEDYSGYGRGFIHVIAASYTSQDPPPMPFPQGSA